METCTYGSEAGCRKPTTVRWHGADSRAYKVTDDKISEDMDKLMEKRKSSSQTDKKQTSI